MEVLDLWTQVRGDIMNLPALALVLLTPSVYVEQGVAGVFGAATAPVGYALPMDRTHVANPYSVSELGAEWTPTRRIKLTLAARHLSSIRTRSDSGDNTVEFRVRYYLRRGE